MSKTYIDAKDLVCKNCPPQNLIGDFGSKTHVLCLNCGEEIEIPIAGIEFEDKKSHSEKYRTI